MAHYDAATLTDPIAMHGAGALDKLL